MNTSRTEIINAERQRTLDYLASTDPVAAEAFRALLNRLNDLERNDEAEELLHHERADA